MKWMIASPTQGVRVPDTGMDVLRVRHTGDRGSEMARSASHGKGFNNLLYF
jgi:hypothetical protein